MFRKLPRLLLFLLPFLSWATLAKDNLTIYTYDSFTAPWGAGPQLKKIFEKKCNCQVNFVALADGAAILNRLRMEGSHSTADIVIGLDNNLMGTAAATKLFVKPNIDTTHLSLPIKWDNPYFIPYDYGYFSFIYNSQLLKNPPSSLQELVDSTYPWRIIYEDPRTSTPGLGLLLWMQKVFGENTPAAWQKLAKKTVTVTKGWSEAYRLFLQGEADLVLSYTTSPAYHIATEHDNRYKAASFKEGNYIQIEVAGQLASSQHPALAQSFLQFLLTPESQQIIAAKNLMYPVLPVTLPASYQQLTIPAKTLLFPARQVAQYRTQWIKSWQNAVSQ